MTTYHLVMCIDEGSLIPYCVYVSTDNTDACTNLSNVLSTEITNAQAVYPDCTFTSKTTLDGTKGIVIKQKEIIEDCNINGIYESELSVTTTRQSIYKKYYISCVNQ